VSTFFGERVSARGSRVPDSGAQRRNPFDPTHDVYRWRSL
jgi:hypothetical protein